MRRIIGLSLLALALVGGGRDLWGAEFVPPENPPRFLFIVEKSDATRAAGVDLPQTMFDLVYRGANGHLPYGGVFEIWVFGEETIYRGFEPQMLTPNNRLSLASRASAYVRTINCGGPAEITKLVEHLRGASELGLELTIILVTAPETRLSGTRRDAEINAALEANSEAQLAAARPFITAMRVQDGLLAVARVNDSPFTMVIPPMPPSQLTAAEREQRLAAAREARIQKEQPVPPPAIQAPPVVITRPSRDIPDEEREGAIILKGTPKKPEPDPQPALVDAAPKSPATAETDPSPASSSAANAAETASQASKVGSPQPTAAVSPEISGARSTPSATAGNDVASIPGVPPEPGQTAGPTNLVPQTAVTVPTQTWLTAGGLFVAGLGFFIVAALLSWVLLRRARSASGPSYITRSLEHRRE